MAHVVRMNKKSSHQKPHKSNFKKGATKKPLANSTQVPLKIKWETMPPYLIKQLDIGADCRVYCVRDVFKKTCQNSFSVSHVNVQISVFQSCEKLDEVTAGQFMHKEKCWQPFLVCKAHDRYLRQLFSSCLFSHLNIHVGVQISPSCTCILRIPYCIKAFASLLRDNSDTSQGYFIIPSL